jgi:hypothetical protein
MESLCTKALIFLKLATTDIGTELREKAYKFSLKKLDKPTVSRTQYHIVSFTLNINNLRLQIEQTNHYSEVRV